MCDVVGFSDDEDLSKTARPKTAARNGLDIREVLLLVE